MVRRVDRLAEPTRPLPFIALLHRRDRSPSPPPPAAVRPRRAAWIATPSGFGPLSGGRLSPKKNQSRLEADQSRLEADQQSRLEAGRPGGARGRAHA